MQVLHPIKHETQTAEKCTFCKRRLNLGRGGAPGDAGARRADDDVLGQKDLQRLLGKR